MLIKHDHPRAPPQPHFYLSTRLLDLIDFYRLLDFIVKSNDLTTCQTTYSTGQTDGWLNMNGWMEGWIDSLMVCVVSADFEALYEGILKCLCWLQEGGPSACKSDTTEPHSMCEHIRVWFTPSSVKHNSCELVSLLLKGTFHRFSH